LTSKQIELPERRSSDQEKQTIYFSWEFFSKGKSSTFLAEKLRVGQKDSFNRLCQLSG
jgi:hypothetical protein